MSLPLPVHLNLISSGQIRLVGEAFPPASPLHRPGGSPCLTSTLLKPLLAAPSCKPTLTPSSPQCLTPAWLQAGEERKDTPHCHVDGVRGSGWDGLAPFSFHSTLLPGIRSF